MFCFIGFELGSVRRICSAFPEPPLSSTNVTRCHPRVPAFSWHMSNLGNIQSAGCRPRCYCRSSKGLVDVNWHTSGIDEQPASASALNHVLCLFTCVEGDKDESGIASDAGDNNPAELKGWPSRLLVHQTK